MIMDKQKQHSQIKKKENPEKERRPLFFQEPRRKMMRLTHRVAN